jgi:hypothetical protein
VEEGGPLQGFPVGVLEELSLGRAPPGIPPPERLRVGVHDAGREIRASELAVGAEEDRVGLAALSVSLPLMLELGCWATSGHCGPPLGGVYTG